MRVVVWIGKEPNQLALVHKIKEEFDVVGIVYEEKKSKKNRSLKDFFTRVVVRILFSKIPKTWFELLTYYKNKYPNDLEIESLTVENINDPRVKSFTEVLNPDIICVSGTRLIKKATINTSSTLGVLNLHTGLSPHVKGGPNCTNWCISKGWFNLIGNTIMWIDEGIDTGNLFLVEKTSFNGNENFFQIHFKVMEHAHELYLRALRKLNKNELASIPQNSVSKGVTFYNKDWGIKEHWNLYRNLKRFKNEIHRL